MKRRKTRKSSQHASVQTTTLPTFLDHVRELQGRLFIVGIAFAVAAAAAVPFFDRIVGVMLAPLSDQQKLVYLTPGGAINFMLKVCIYIGIIGALPVIIFHLYRFLMPVVRQIHLRTALKYTAASIVLAITGIIFAYVVSLPAALYFLTSFNLYHIDPMLTIDSYLSFVMTYLVAGAVLFQLPLIITIIDSVKPLTPKKLMKSQRYIIVGSFIVAAIVTPTPDALNQTILASPIIVMYQVGVIIIALKHRRRMAAIKVKAVVKEKPQLVVQPTPVVNTTIQYQPKPLPQPIQTMYQPHPPAPIVKQQARLISDMRKQTKRAALHRLNASFYLPTQLEKTFAQPPREEPLLMRPRRSIEGIIVPQRVTSA